MIASGSASNCVNKSFAPAFRPPLTEVGTKAEASKKAFELKNRVIFVAATIFANAACMAACYAAATGSIGVGCAFLLVAPLCVLAIFCNLTMLRAIEVTPPPTIPARAEPAESKGGETGSFAGSLPSPGLLAGLVDAHSSPSALEAAPTLGSMAPNPASKSSAGTAIPPPTVPTISTSEERKACPNFKIEPVEVWKRVKLLGLGTFKMVSLVEHRVTKELAARAQVLPPVLNTTPKGEAEKGLLNEVACYQKLLKIPAGIARMHRTQLVDINDDSQVKKNGILLEYYPHTLGSIRKSLEPQHLVRITYQLVQGLIGMHKQNIYHLDVKPENILVRTSEAGDYEAALCDFGLSIENPTMEDLTHRYGTLTFIPPEDPDVGEYPPSEVQAKQDAWALGMTLHITIFNGERQSWLPSFINGKDYLARLDKVTRAGQELEGYTEPEEKESLEHIIWRLLDPNIRTRPLLQDILDDLEALLDMRPGLGCLV
jgi:hypothetical protein